MTTLYRLYNSADELLYIGIAEHWPSRLNSHRSDKPWFGEVIQVRLVHYQSRAEAAQAEREMIRTECPRHNVQHNRETRQPRKFERPEPTRRLFDVGECVALGLTDGQCPVGLITAIDDQRVTLDLFSWLTGYFGHETELVPMNEIRRVRVARSERKGDMRFFDMDDIERFQRQWQRQHQAQLF